MGKSLGLKDVSNLLKIRNQQFPEHLKMSILKQQITQRIKCNSPK